MKPNIEELKKKFAGKYLQWEKSQQGQASGYEYEKTFVEMWQQLGNEMLQKSVGELKKSRNTKKNFKQAWER